MLWILQAVLAALFLREGGRKILKPETMKARGLSEVGWLLFIGVSEVLGAMGLLLPSLTRILPRLTPLAAVGIAVIMVLATRFHLMRHEGKAAGWTAALMIVSGFVAYGRFFLSPLS